MSSSIVCAPVIRRRVDIHAALRESVEHLIKSDDVHLSIRPVIAISALPCDHHHHMRYYIINDAFPVRVSETGATDIFAQDETWHPTSLDLRTVDSRREITEAQALSSWADAAEFDRIAQEMEAMGTERYPDDDVTHVILPARPRK